MRASVIPLARCHAYRAFTRLPPDGIERWRGRRAGRVAIAAYQRLLAGGPLMVATGHGAGLLLETETLAVTNIQAYGLVRGVLEPGVQEALRRHVGPGTVVYDVGANLGFFSLLAARFAGPSGAVEAFEPLALNAAGLRGNLALNDARTVTVHEVAVGAASGRAQLLSVDEGGWSVLADRGWHPRTREVLEVDVVTIDELVAGGLRPPGVLKIDVEGSEIAVLQGMRDTIRDHSPVIICELHETNAEFLDAVDELGYEACNLDGPEPIADAGAVHVLAMRAGVRAPTAAAP